MYKSYNILSIDAYKYDNGWNWNNWFNAGKIEIDIDASNRTIFKALRENGYLSDYSKGRVSLNDDGYNLVICERSNNMPVFAIVYGDQH